MALVSQPPHSSIASMTVFSVLIGRHITHVSSTILLFLHHLYIVHFYVYISDLKLLHVQTNYPNAYATDHKGLTTFNSILVTGVYINFSSFLSKIAFSKAV